MVEPLTGYDRLDVSLYNLLQGQVGAAGKALVAPDNLDPSQRKGVGEGLFGDLPGPLKVLTDTITNPLFLLGAVLSIKFPIASASQLFKFNKEMVGLKTRLPWLQRQVSSLPMQFANTEVPKLMDELMTVVGTFKDRHAISLLTAVEEYNKAMGRGMGLEVPQPVQRRLFAFLDGMHKGEGPLQHAFKMSAPLVDEGKLVTAMGGVGSPEYQLAQKVRGAMDRIYSEAYGEDNYQQRIIRALNAKIASRNRRDLEIARKAKYNPEDYPTPRPLIEDSMPVSRVRKSLIKMGVNVRPVGGWEELIHEAEGQGMISKQELDAPRAAIASALAKAGFEEDSLAIRKLRDYVPHMSRMTQEDYEDLIADMMESGGDKQQAANLMTAIASTRRTAPSSNERRWRMIPDLGDLAELEKMGVVNATAKREMMAGIEAEVQKNLLAMREVQTGEQLVKLTDTVLRGTTAQQRSRERIIEEMAAKYRTGVPIDQIVDEFERTTLVRYAKTRQYSMRLFPVLQRYLGAVANQHGWTTTTTQYKGAKMGLGEAILHETDRMDTVGRNMMKDTYIPLAMGRMTFKQSIQNLEWADTRDRWMQALTDEQGWMKLVPAPIKSFLKKQLMDYNGPMSLGSFSGKLAGYFYTSTIGLNPSSALKNLLQSVLTTGPLIGARATMDGVKVAAERMGRYAELRMSGKVRDEAFSKAFPEFLESHMEPSPIADRLFKTWVEDLYDSSAATTLGHGASHTVTKAVEGIRDKMMLMFQQSERFNRLAAYYGGLSKGVRDGVGRGWHDPAVKQFARQVVQFTQFPAGPGQGPYATLQWPSLLKQFTYFPLRFAEALMGSTMMPYGKEGKYASAWWGRKNLGMIGRSVAASTAAYTAGKDLLGVDLSQGLMLGALPLPNDTQGPFAPFPIVPPALSVAGSLASSVATGDWSNMNRALPLLVPGGVALSKLRRVMPSPLGYADYDHPTPDGRIPLHSQTGALTGYVTPGQLLAKGLGFGTIDASKEQELMGYLQKQRDQIRQYRRGYLEALARNDMGEASAIQQEFGRNFPSLKKIYVKQQDIDAIKVRGTITRLERVLDTLPAQYRPVYGQMVAAALGTSAEGLMGVDPEFLQAPQSSWANRPRTPGLSQSQMGQVGQQGSGGTGGSSWGGSLGQGIGATGLPVF